MIPGATVTLTSDARGTQLPPAFTNTNGDFVIATCPDTYTIQVSMDDSRRSSAAASP